MFVPGEFTSFYVCANLTSELEQTECVGERERDRERVVHVNKMKNYDWSLDSRQF